MRKYTGEFALIITAIIWGSGFVASAIALDYYTPYQMLAIRFSVGAIVLMFIFFKRIKGIRKSLILKGIILGFFLYIAFALQTVGLQFTTPSKNAFLTAVNVVIVPFIGLLIYKKKLDIYELSGAVLSMIGIALLSLEGSMKINIGDLLSFLCAIAFAFHIFYTAKFVKNEDPIILTWLQMVTASIVGIIVIIFRDEEIMAIGTEPLLPVLYLGVFSTTIAYLLQTTAQKHLSETKAAIFLSTESLFAMIFSIMILNEIVTTRMVFGAITILTAILVAETKLGKQMKMT